MFSDTGFRTYAATRDPVAYAARNKGRINWFDMEYALRDRALMRALAEIA